MKITPVSDLDKKWLIIAIVLAAVVCYVNTLKNPFIWDQEVVIQDNPLIRSWKYIPTVFQSNVEGRRLVATGFYRPMEVISYMFDYTFWKLNPAGYHISSTVYHALNAILIFLLLMRMKLSKTQAFIVSIIYAIHPANTETVTYSIRGDLLAELFSLACFYLLLISNSGKVYILVFAGISYVLALFAKEWAAVVPFLMLLYFLIFQQSESMSPVKRFKLIGLNLRITLSALILISLAYIIIRGVLVAGSPHAPLSIISHSSLWERLLTVPRILLTYISLAVFPMRLHMEYHFLTKSVFDPYFIFGVPLLILAGYALYRHIKSLPAQDLEYKKQLIFFAAWFLLGLTFFYNIAITLHATLTEHWLYFSLTGLLALLVLIGSKFYEKFPASRNYLIILIAFLSCYYTVYTIKRNHVWSTAMWLYQNDLKYEPNSFVLHNNVGVIHFRNGNLAEAKKDFINAIKVSPQNKYEVAYNNLGVILQREGDIKNAEKAYAESIRLNNYELAFGNLSYIYIATQRINEAIMLCTEGVKQFPFNGTIRYNLALAYFFRSDFDNALAQLAFLKKNLNSENAEVNQLIEKILEEKSRKPLKGRK